METFFIILGALGVGGWIATLIDRFTGYRLEKRKILYDKKFIAYSEFAQFALGFNSDEKPKHILKAMADTARISLLITDDDLVSKIREFIIKLDEVQEKEESLGEETEEEYLTLIATSRVIVDALRRDLRQTL